MILPFPSRGRPRQHTHQARPAGKAALLSDMRHTPGLLETSWCHKASNNQKPRKRIGRTMNPLTPALPLDEIAGPSAAARQVLMTAAFALPNEAGLIRHAPPFHTPPAI